jgi:hypothetical protein
MLFRTNQPWASILVSAILLPWTIRLASPINAQASTVKKIQVPLKRCSIIQNQSILYTAPTDYLWTQKKGMGSPFIPAEITTLKPGTVVRVGDKMTFTSARTSMAENWASISVPPVGWGWIRSENLSGDQNTVCDDPKPPTKHQKTNHP